MKLTTSQLQKQLLLPQLIRTMEILELSQAELKELIEEEVLSNPVLETIKKDRINKIRTKKTLSSNFDREAFLENLSTSDVTLKRILFEQINLLNWSEREKYIAELIISSLDENGFLQKKEDGKVAPVNPVELISTLDISLEEFENVREKIKLLSPMGIGCYNVYEYLLFQAKEKYGIQSNEYKILSLYSDLLKKKQYETIAKKMKVKLEDVKKAIENISNFNISPVDFVNTHIEYLIPDAIVKVDNNKIELKLNEENIPELKINTEYINLYENLKNNSEKKFLKENIDRAKILIENLQSRKEILYKVILKIIEKQKDFFIKGTSLVPLKLKDVATELNIHESTVSRVIKNKYIQTNKGIFPLKYFFSGSSGGEGVSKNSVKELIKEIIENEDKNNPLNDDVIVNILRKKNIKISRRTVAKYRKELNIPPAHLRKNTL